jgi:hypothetical protein
MHILALGALLLPGAFSAVHGFQTSFEFFDSAGHFPYYKMMHYGAIGQAAFGVLVVIISLAHLAVRRLRGH